MYIYIYIYIYIDIVHIITKQCFFFFYGTRGICTDCGGFRVSYSLACDSIHVGHWEYMNNNLYNDMLIFIT